MKQKKSSLVPLSLLLLLTLLFLSVPMGCGGGGGGSSSGGGGGGGNGDVTNKEAEQVSWEVFRQVYNNPSDAYDPGSSSRSMILTEIANDINDRIQKGSRPTEEINKIITDPHDGDGTLVISGTYEYNADTRDWTATLSMVYTDFYMGIPYYDETEYNANGSLSVDIEFSYSDKTMSADVAYAGYHIDGEDTAYEYTGSISQTGTLESRKLVYYTATADVVMDETLSTGETGSLVISVETTMTLDQDTGARSFKVEGSLVYEDFNGMSDTATFSTDEPIVINEDGEGESGSITITTTAGNEIVITITGSDQMIITFNGLTIYNGTISEFYDGEESPI